MVDDGTGAKEIFRVDNFDLVQVPDEDHGKFYSGDCYVVLYAYNNGGQDRFIVYFWLVSIFNDKCVPCIRNKNQAFRCFYCDNQILNLGTKIKPRWKRNRCIKSGRNRWSFGWSSNTSQSGRRKGTKPFFGDVSRKTQSVSGRIIFLFWRYLLFKI